MSKEELRRLFTLDDGTVSDTHDCGGCERCPSKNFEGLHGSADGAAWEEQDDEAVETDLNTWGHHHRMDHVPDPIMRRAAGDDVSFIFSLQVEGCAIVEKEKAKDAGAGEKTAPAPPPASTATRPGGYRLGAGAGGPAGPAGTAGTMGTMRPPAPMRRPLAPVAAKPNVVHAAAGAGRKAPAPSKKVAPPPAKKAKKGKKDDSESEMELDDSESESESEEEEPPAPQPKKQKAAPPAKKEQPPAKKKQEDVIETKTKAKKYPNGFEIHELKQGKASGKVAKAGKQVTMKYVGRLTNGKVFDQTKGKSTFKFRLGVGEVIKGWDRGVEGMRVGDSRKLVCPPSMAYGSSRTGPIPPNSTLVFEVELVDVR